MRKIFILFTLSLLLLSIEEEIEITAGKSIVILPFYDDSGYRGPWKLHNEIPEMLGDMLIDEYFFVIPMDSVQKALPKPPLELAFDETNEFIDLPDPKIIEVKQIPIKEAIENRESLRSYANKPLTLEELSFVLWCIQGVKDVMVGKATFRTVPSAGARHAFEIYLLVNNVEELQLGLYRFLALEHKLIFINLYKDIADQITEGCMNQSFIQTSAVTFIFTAVTARMKWRYGERGYRYLHLDAGHACQNLYLSAEAIDCGVCAVAAYYDDKLNGALGIDGEEQFIIYVAALGKKRL